MKLLIIDNYDSFTFNLKHMCEMYVSEVDVVRNDHISISDVTKYDKIIISPGPGLPKVDGICVQIIQRYSRDIPILGVCLGAQAIAVAFNLELYNLSKIMHGKQSKIKITDSKSLIYNSFDNEITVGRYHSWAVNMNNNQNFIISAIDEDGVVMSFHHKHYPLTGIQYHPESILTPSGQLILSNWLQN